MRTSRFLKESLTFKEVEKSEHCLNSCGFLYKRILKMLFNSATNLTPY